MSAKLAAFIDWIAVLDWRHLGTEVAYQKISKSAFKNKIIAKLDCITDKFASYHVWKAWCVFKMNIYRMEIHLYQGWPRLFCGTFKESLLFTCMGVQEDLNISSRQCSFIDWLSLVGQRVRPNSTHLHIDSIDEHLRCYIAGCGL